MFDFDYWKDLFKSDPDNFHKQRLAHIEKEIEKKYPKGSAEYKKYLRVVEAFDDELNMIDDPKMRLEVAQRVLQEHLTQLSGKMTELQRMAKEYYENHNIE